MTKHQSTKEYYSANFEDYLSLTQGVDMTEHYNLFLKHLPEGAKILDVGFGSGRDMLYFAAKGYDVVGIDNVAEFVENAKKCGLTAELCDLHHITYTDAFDGVWACASLLHSDNLPLALSNVYKALKMGGYAYVSMKIGEGTEVVGGRFYQYVTEDTLNALAEAAGLATVETVISRDMLGRKNGWINVLLAKRN